jgi:DMSO/TMAO reductase YedYZ heme-binding membrane subunit
MFHKPSSFRDYLVAGLMTTILLVLASCYLLIRRGYFFDAPPTADTLYVPNKALAGVAMTLLAFTFLIGPLARYFDRFDTWIGYRKEIGILGGFLAILHALVSYFLLPTKFPQEWLDFSTPAFGAGLLGAALLLLLFVLSWKSILTRIPGQIWWFFQRWGLRLAILLTLVHVYVMKWQSWVKWFTQGGGKATPELTHPEMAGLGILLTVFITWVVVVRIYESLFLFKDFGFSTKEISMDPVLKAKGRRFFLGSLAVFFIFFLIILTRWLI